MSTDLQKRAPEMLGTYFGADVICPECGSPMKNVLFETLCEDLRNPTRSAIVNRPTNRYRCMKCDAVRDLSLKYEPVKGLKRFGKLIGRR
jgi:hypothetical protein